MCIASRRAKVGSPPRTRTSTPTLFAGGWTYSASSSSPSASSREAPRISTSSTIRPIILVGREGVGARGTEVLQHALGEGQEHVVLRDALGLAADRGVRIVVCGD